MAAGSPVASTWRRSSFDPSAAVRFVSSAAAHVCADSDPSSLPHRNASWSSENVEAPMTIAAVAHRRPE